MYYTGTKEQCEEYLSTVNSSQNYQGVTSTWSEVLEIDGKFYIMKHPNHDSNLELTSLTNKSNRDDQL